MRRGAVLAGVLISGAGAAAAELPDLPVPEHALPRFEQVLPLATLHLPVGVATADHLPTEPVEGLVETRTWVIEPQADKVPPVLAVIDPLRAALTAAGYEIVLDCAAEACGGFDFRRQVALVPAPDMFLNLRDFHALSARQGETAVAILASRSGVAGFLQIASASPPRAEPAISRETQEVPFVSEDAGEAAEGHSIAETLLVEGVAILTGVDFASGSADMTGEVSDDLQALVQFLADNPDARIALVGHTDADGSLGGNIALSRERAETVRAYLVSERGVAPDRVQAEGVGYLAPIAPLIDPSHAAENRRVEVVLLPG